MIIQSNVWYDKAIVPPSTYKLLLFDGVETCPGYYYNHRFYVENIDVTDIVKQWCIPEKGEKPYCGQAVKLND